MKRLIKNGRVVDPATGTDAILDILLDGAKIAAVGKNLDKRVEAKGAQLFDATGLVVAPGFIDLHVHLREPGFERKETIETGLAAALAGGFTGVACMPNTNPVNDSASVTRYILHRAAEVSPVAVYPVGAVTQESKGEDLAPFAELKEAGVRLLSDDGRPVASSRVLRRALEYAGSLGLTILDHCEDLDLAHGGCMHEGKVSAKLGLRGVPAESESIPVQRDLALARMTGQRIHICHVSTKLSVEAIRLAKKRKIRVTAEAAPHHFTLTDEEIGAFDANYKMSPPLRSKEDVAAVIEGLADGTLDCIATDHAPHAWEEKTVEFDHAPNGILGLQTAVALAIEQLVLTEKVPLMRMVEAFSSAPARILGLNNKGRLAEGADADLTLFSLKKETFLTTADIKSASKNSPFLNRKIQGAIAATVIAGKIYPV